MNGNNSKREQAEKLLRSFTDIDDRFLEEAMKEPAAGEGAQVTGEGALSAGTESPQAGAKTPSGGRKIRRYSTWALTAAACLTVVIIGRYVTLNRNAGLKNEQPAAVSDEVKITEVPEMYDEVTGAEAPGADAVNEAEEAVPLEAAGEAKSQDTVNAVNEADKGADVLYESAQIANPFTDTKTLEEAQEIAGFDMQVPDAAAPYTVVNYRAVEGEMLEIIFRDRKGEEGYRIRKAAGEDDISGDYNEYAKEKTIRLSDGTKVTLRGDKDDEWSVAMWTAEDGEGKDVYSFAVCSGEKTFTSKEVKEMAEVMSRH
ncbi:MAG: hypothetical protein IJ820_07650 [Lachnospiraceae bacterium]|nr:hypothetical protein [Lachnospiraceae bacterium]